MSDYINVDVASRRALFEPLEDSPTKRWKNKRNNLGSGKFGVISRSRRNEKPKHHRNFILEVIEILKCFPEEHFTVVTTDRSVTIQFHGEVLSKFETPESFSEYVHNVIIGKPLHCLLDEMNTKYTFDDYAPICHIEWNPKEFDTKKSKVSFEDKCNPRRLRHPTPKPEEPEMSFEEACAHFKKFMTDPRSALAMKVIDAHVNHELEERDPETYRYLQKLMGKEEMQVALTHVSEILSRN